MAMADPGLSADFPAAIITLPALPEALIPVFTLKYPLESSPTPVDSLTGPDDAEETAPLSVAPIVTSPETIAPAPEITVTLPPTAFAELPAETITLPEAPEDEPPAFICTFPPAKEATPGSTMIGAPRSPLIVPVFRVSLPLPPF
jgi:hypothetical protein